MSKLLVTGAAGFIGANFVHYWHGANPDDTIVELDCLSYAGNKHNLAAALSQPWFTFRPLNSRRSAPANARGIVNPPRRSSPATRIPNQPDFDNRKVTRCRTRSLG